VPLTTDPQASPVLALETLGILLVGSPFVSWLALLVAVPVSAFAAARGFAGWGVSVLGGFLTGILAALFMNGFEASKEAYVLGLVGLILALFYWGAIRLVHPTAMGVGFKAPQP
jgi:predicted lipid-binding transport protein (Tim44 family)